MGPSVYYGESLERLWDVFELWRGEVPLWFESSMV